MTSSVTGGAPDEPAVVETAAGGAGEETLEGVAMPGLAAAKRLIAVDVNEEAAVVSNPPVDDGTVTTGFTAC